MVGQCVQVDSNLFCGFQWIELNACGWFYPPLQFHSMCIDQWLKQQATCPVCKFRLGTSQPQAPNASGATYTV
jgi:hypothetical protein